MQEYQFQDEDIRLIDVIDAFKKYSLYLLKKFYIVIIGVGGFTYLGYLFAVKSPPKFIAFTSFNAVDARASGGLMSLASTFGLGMGGSTNDVLMGIYSSNYAFKKALLADVFMNGREDKLGNFYSEIYGYKDGLEEEGIKDFKFTANSIYNMSKLEDSISSMMYYAFIDDALEIEYEVTAGLVYANIETPNYDLSKNLALEILKSIREFFQDKQDKASVQNFQKAQRRLDSIKTEIKIREVALAKSQDQNIFNEKRLGIVQEQKLQRELGVLNIMYSDAANTFEAAKAGVNTKSESLKIVDDPLFSTYAKYRSAFLFGLIGFAIGIVLVIIPLLLNKAAIDSRAEEAEKQKALQQEQVIENTVTQ
ncbi:MAG: hypothetical protein H6553_03195 [Chitinophagales bacterium]|nr:hypothetical protein [Chitinophagales bacterium]